MSTNLELPPDDDKVDVLLRNRELPPDDDKVDVLLRDETSNLINCINQDIK